LPVATRAGRTPGNQWVFQSPRGGLRGTPMQYRNPHAVGRSIGHPMQCRTPHAIGRTLDNPMQSDHPMQSAGGGNPYGTSEPLWNRRGSARPCSNRFHLWTISAPPSHHKNRWRTGDGGPRGWSFWITPQSSRGRGPSPGDGPQLPGRGGGTVGADDQDHRRPSSEAARTIATMPARTASGSFPHRSMMVAKPGSVLHVSWGK
jgi:hypothetical protein